MTAGSNCWADSSRQLCFAQSKA